MSKRPYPLGLISFVGLIFLAIFVIFFSPKASSIKNSVEKSVIPKFNKRIDSISTVQVNEKFSSAWDEKVLELDSKNEATRLEMMRETRSATIRIAKSEFNRLWNSKMKSLQNQKKSLERAKNQPLSCEDSLREAYRIIDSLLAKRP